mgnify:CR=1 FL=1
MSIMKTLSNLWEQTAFMNLEWGNYVMILVALVFLYLAIKHGFEPLLLVPIAFGMLLVNIYPDIMADPYVDAMGIEHAGGLLHYFFILDEWSILPSLIFMGVGAMTDFGPLIANPKSFILGAAAQLGIYSAYFLAIFLGFNGKAAAAISIIGGADGPTSIFLAGKLGQTELMGPIAVAAYSYMSLVPIIQPPIMKLCTTEKERKIKMDQLRPVTKIEKILFPIIGFLLILLSIAVFWKRIKHNFLHFERRFYANLHAVDRDKITVLDKRTKFLHLARLTVSADSRFVGKSLRTLDLRTRRGITIVSIQRGSRKINIPHSDDILLPADRIAVVGTDAELKRFAAEVEVEPAAPTSGVDEVVMRQFSVSPSSVLVGMTVSQFVVMCGGEGIVIGIERQDGTFVEPLGLVRFRPYDLVWVAGTREPLRKLLGSDTPQSQKRVKAASRHGLFMRLGARLWLWLTGRSR